MKIFKRIAIGFVIAGLLAANMYQAYVIGYQRELIFNMYRFIGAGCPFSQLN